MEVNVGVFKGGDAQTVPETGDSWTTTMCPQAHEMRELVIRLAKAGDADVVRRVLEYVSEDPVSGQEKWPKA